MDFRDIDPENVGLLPQHKARLEKFADRYCDANTRAARREVALLAAADVVKEFKITGKEEIALTNQVCFFRNRVQWSNLERLTLCDLSVLSTGFMTGLLGTSTTSSPKSLGF